MNNLEVLAAFYDGRFIKLGVMAICAIGLMAAIAVRQSANADEVYRARVSVADLDLSTAKGMQAARERVHAAARNLCGRAEDPLDLSHQANFVACVDAAMTAALPKLEPAALAAVAKPRSVEP